MSNTKLRPVSDPDETERQQRYQAALEGTDLTDIPDSIAGELIQGAAGRIEAMCGHVQVTKFLAEAVTSDSPIDTSIEGVTMGLFLTFDWLTKSQERLVDFEAARARMLREQSNG